MYWVTEAIEFALVHTEDIEKANTKRVGRAATVSYVARDGRREEKRLIYPERWLRMARGVREYFSDEKRFCDFVESRYDRQEDWREACVRMGVSKDVYYDTRAEFLRMAELFAVHYGAVVPSDCRM